MFADKFVITEGCHAGVAKIFAEKAAKINQSLSETERLKMLGVAHWGTLKNRECLLNNSPENAGKMVSDSQEGNNHPITERERKQQSTLFR